MLTLSQYLVCSVCLLFVLIVCDCICYTYVLLLTCNLRHVINNLLMDDCNTQCEKRLEFQSTVLLIHWIRLVSAFHMTCVQSLSHTSVEQNNLFSLS